MDISRILSTISQAIVLAPPEVQPPAPTGRAVAIKRYAAGQTDARGLRAELLRLGYSEAQAAQAQTDAELERGYGVWSDLLAAIRERYMDGRLGDDEMLGLLYQQIVDPGQAEAQAELWRQVKLPKLAPPKAAEIPTLSVAQLLAAYGAGVLSAAALEAGLTDRLYSPADIVILVDTAAAKLPKPKPAEYQPIALADLRALLALGKITAAAFRAELVRRQYAPADADLMLSLEQARIASRLAPPDLKMLPLADLRALYALDQISSAVFQAQLQRLGYEALAVAGEIALADVRKLPSPAPVHELAEGQLVALYVLGEITESNLMAELRIRNYSPDAINGVVLLARSRLAVASPA